MSILIKGMEMPKRCGLCPCFHAEHPMHCQAVKAHKDKRIIAPYGAPIPDWCPLIELPPHGRLIDALRTCYDTETITMDNGDEYIHYGDAVGEIEQLPPIQPKRGRWLYCEDTTADCVDGYRCDQCGFFVPWDYQHKGIDFIQDYNFCPHCGAKMEVTE